MLTDSIPPDPIAEADDSAVETTAALARHAAYTAQPTWTTPDGEIYALQAFTGWREMLLWELDELDGGTDWQGIAAGRHTLILPLAHKLLWLLSHGPAETDRARLNRTQWLRDIGDWAATHVPRLDAEKQTAAIQLVWRLLEEVKINRAIPRPTGTQKEGNSPRH